MLLWPSVVAMHVQRLLRLQATPGLTWSSGQNARGWDMGRKRDTFGQEHIATFLSGAMKFKDPSPSLERKMVLKVYNMTLLLSRFVWKHIGQVGEWH